MPRRPPQSSLAAALAVLALGACSEAPQAEPALPPLPAGDALPPDVEGMLFGSPDACSNDDVCVSGVCYYGACGGLLSVDSRWMQERIAATLKDRVDRQPPLRERVVHDLGRVLRRKSAELPFRARVVVGLEVLGAADVLADALPDLPEPVAEIAAPSLARLGRAEGLAHTLALTESDALPTAVEALRALGESHLPDALLGLLRALGPSLDTEIQVAAVEALGALGDKRAIGPLVAYLRDAPDSLVVPVVRALRTLSGAALGADRDAWDAWVAKNPPPAAPPFTPREPSSEDDLGLPTP
ncbi:MAG: HEAT repeat domain-containing protein [Myxococcales bacterium]|nr:HEAT repeat domain-containing protein [Myxococcales bacterium]MCB9733795.1 HEAT repeat domain-containing protein [Deltaproteobacteria bacterium]